MYACIRGANYRCTATVAEGNLSLVRGKATYCMDEEMKTSKTLAVAPSAALCSVVVPRYL